MRWFNDHLKCSILKIRLVSDPEIIQSSDPSLLDCKEGDRKLSIEGLHGPNEMCMENTKFLQN